MKFNVIHAVNSLIGEYRRFLKTSYRFLDDSLRRQFEDHLSKTDVIVKGPYVTLTKDFVKGKTIKELVDSGQLERELLKANWPFGEGRLFLHQEQALIAGGAGRSFIVTTGTGSGKTEAFLLPVLDGILKRKKEGITGLQAVFIYPMNALANDQLERMRRLLRGSGLDISFGLYTGDSDAATQSLQESPAEKERTTRNAIRLNPPDIILTNYKQLEFLLIRKEDRGIFTPALRYLVLDEIHSYRGALATELSCLIRRLKTHAGLEAGELVAIGTSATVLASSDGPSKLANFASTLFGEIVRDEEIIKEAYEDKPNEAEPWMPSFPNIEDKDLSELDVANDEAVIKLAEKLTGKKGPDKGPIAERVAAVLSGNKIVTVLEKLFSVPISLDQATQLLQQQLSERAVIAAEDVKREIQAYLLIGSIGEDDSPPRFRPKLHTFFHGVYDVSICTNPECRTLIPHGGTICDKCGSVARPAALCRTCGQDFIKVRFERPDDNLTYPSADFFSDENTAFLTHEIRELPEMDTEEETEEAQLRVEQPSQHMGSPSRNERLRESNLDQVGFCTSCGRVLEKDSICPTCNKKTTLMFINRGKLNTCPACGDIYTRGDIVTPLRTGTASTVAILITHHLDNLEAADRKLLVFSDNRQDAAHQAGYTEDKHRTFILRHIVAKEIQQAGDLGIELNEFPERLFDCYQRLGIIPRRPNRHERELWLFALTFEVANEFTRYSRQRSSLENLGIVGVDYELLGELFKDQEFLNIVQLYNLDPLVASNLTRAILDIMRKNRALAFDFFQEYLDPNKRRYREIEAEPYNVRIPERDRHPRAFALDRPEHIRRSSRLMGCVQENPRAGQLTATQKIVFKILGNRDKSESFIRAIIPLLEEHEILKHVPSFYIPNKERTQALHPLQIDPRVIRLFRANEGFRCNACQTWRPYNLPVCPTPRCSSGQLVKVSCDKENYYVKSYLERSPKRLIVREHSAQISGEERTKRETSFKEGQIDALVCTPTLELGVDIGPLLTVVLRNVPPTPANYGQRVGRAGRRLRIGFVSTFCAGSPHDRHAFEKPEWFVSGRFDPPKLRLENPKVVYRHLRSFLLERLNSQVPLMLGDLLDDIRHPTRWKTEMMQILYSEIDRRREELINKLSNLFAGDLKDGRVTRFGSEDASKVVDGMKDRMNFIFEGWWQRVKQLDKEYREFSTIGSPKQDEKKASARKRAYYEITQDSERAYTLNYLATKDFLPAYQFPIDTFSLDPGVTDTPTLFRASAVAISEFAPGNFIYANGHKLKSIRVLFPGGPGTHGATGSDAQSSGRLQAYHFCEQCDEVVESGRNHCPRCNAPLPAATDVVFADAFEAEENIRISSDEEARQREIQDIRETLLTKDAEKSILFPYKLTPAEHLHLAEIMMTNWGRLENITGNGTKFRLCPDCGRHMPYNPSAPTRNQDIQKWEQYHRRFCAGQLLSLVLAYKFETDCLILNIPSQPDLISAGRRAFSPALITLAEALLVGAENVLELEPGEIRTFIRKTPPQTIIDQIVFYEVVPGGAGYLEEMARRLPEIAQESITRLFGHECRKACYLCLKRYSNQRWHSSFDKDAVRDLLVILSEQDHVEAIEVQTGAGQEKLKEMLQMRLNGTDESLTRYPKGEIEEPLRRALEKMVGLPAGLRDYEVKDQMGRLITVPDFTWPDVKLAVYCDGFAIHGNIETLEADARKRNFLQTDGWVVLTFWGRAILKNPDLCAQQIAQVYKQRHKAYKEPS